ncbi:MAG: beta-ketoacyl synthase N-terminal-like domain-containing protein [Planctomycetaceae bacterium]
MTSQPTSARRVVITGLGVMSPEGVGRTQFMEHLRAGKSGVTPVHGLAAPVGAEVAELTEESAKKIYLKGQRKQLKVMSRDVLLGVAGAMMAVEDSGLPQPFTEPERVGVEFGANLMLTPPHELADPSKPCLTAETGAFNFSQWGDAGLRAMEPLWMLKFLPNMPACHVGIFTDSRGPNNSITQNEVSGALAISEATSIIRRGHAEVMITGATGNTLHATKSLHQRFWNELGFDAEHPDRSVKPFDSRRNGPVIAEAACGMVLEVEEFARSRGANILGTILGTGSSCVSNVDGEANIQQALTNAMRSAMRSAGLAPADIGHISAHGLGARDGDQAEALAIHEVFGELGSTIPVVALKGYHGNPGAAALLIEVAASLLFLQEGEIPFSLNCEQPDPECRLNIVVNQPLKTDRRIFMALSYTLIGQAAAVIIQC